MRAARNALRLLGEGAPPPLEKPAYRENVRLLRRELLRAQATLRAAPEALVVLVSGVDGAGKGDTVNLLNAWLDPRWIRTHAFDQPSDEERERPEFWRYWRVLPRHGQIGVLLSAWYSDPLLARVEGASPRWVAKQIEAIRSFEDMLSAEGCRFLKLWLHLGQAAQQERLRQLEADPLERWRVTPRDWENWKRYPRFEEAAARLMAGSHTPAAPWHVIDGRDPRRRALSVGEAILTALSEPRPRAEPTRSTPKPTRRPAPRRIAERATALSPARYMERLAELRSELAGLHRKARARGISLIAVFEGRDASGKGGAIRRAITAFDARVVNVVRVGPPSKADRKRPYLWRFWNELPRAGRVTFFDRSWYGRVLVERVDALAAERDWRRAYGELNRFEHQIVEHGHVLAKFWLEVDRDEQLRRFQDRRSVPHKRWKLSEEDWHNRRRWKHYDKAIDDMLAATSTRWAPWTVIPANDKRAARLRVLESLCKRLAARLEKADRDTPEPRNRAKKPATRKRKA